MRSTLLSAAALAALWATVACGGMATSPSMMMNSTSMMTSGLGVGTWASTKAMPSQAGTCGGFTWTITSFTATSVTGTFSATCNGTTPMSGTGSAQATLAGNGTINWTGTATAAVPGNNNCAVALSGTVSPAATGVSITYSGTTCLGPVSGTEILGPK